MLRRTSSSSNVKIHPQSNTKKTAPHTPPHRPAQSTTSDLRSSEKEDEVMADYYNESAETVEHPSAPDSSNIASHAVHGFTRPDHQPLPYVVTRGGELELDERAWQLQMMQKDSEQRADRIMEEIGKKFMAQAFAAHGITDISSTPLIKDDAHPETVAVVGAKGFCPAVNRQGDHQTNTPSSNPDFLKDVTVIQKF